MVTQKQAQICGRDAAGMADEELVLEEHTQARQCVAHRGLRDRKPQRPNSAGYRGKPGNYKAGPRKPGARTGGASSGAWSGPGNGTSHAPRFGKATGNGGFGRTGAPARARG